MDLVYGCRICVRKAAHLWACLRNLAPVPDCGMPHGCHTISGMVVYIENNWWRRRESNPGPEVIHVGLYVRSPCTCFAVGSARGQARFTAIDSLFRSYAESSS
jgi:hypothetical protein